MFLCTVLFGLSLALVVPVLALFTRKIFPGISPKRTPGQFKKSYPSLKGGEEKPWALVTGASSGIGLEFADLLAAEGFNVAVVARSKGKLEEICTNAAKAHGVNTRVLCFDLEKKDAAYELHQAVQDLDISVFVNNAGYGHFGDYTEMETSHIENMIQLNCTSVAVLTKLFLADFQKKRPTTRSGFVITSSLGAYTPMAFSSLYAATKAFDHYLSWALWKEMQELNFPIDVISLEPGSTSTGFRATATSGAQAKSDTSASPRDVACRCLNDLQAKRPNSMFGDNDYYLTVMARILPRAMLVKFASDFAKKFRNTKH